MNCSRIQDSMGFSRFAFLCILLMAFLSTCQVATPTPTVQAIATDTLAPPTSTAQPTATEAPTATPYAPLSPNGPYIISKLRSPVSSPIILRNADGTGNQQIKLPENSWILNIEDAISSDGRLAYFKDSFGPPYDLELHLLDIFSGESILVSKLFSDEFPGDLNSLAETYMQLGVPEIRIDNIESLINNSVQRNIAWSPNGKYLAFSAQFGGASADAYLYEIETEDIRRLTNDLTVVDDFNWSPDGKWLLYETLLLGEEYTGSELFAISISEGTDNKIYDGGFFWGGKGWLATDVYMIGSGGDGCCPHNLEALNVTTGERTNVWPDVYERYAYDPENQILAVSGLPDRSEEPSDTNIPGTYFMNLNGEIEFIFEKVYLPQFRGGDISRFVSNSRDGVIGVGADSSSHIISEPEIGQSFSISPDYRWLLVETPTEFSLYDAQDQLITTIKNTISPKTPIKRVVWRPDGEGVFFVTGLEIYYLAIPYGSIEYVEDCPESECWLRYHGQSTWLP